MRREQILEAWDRGASYWNAWNGQVFSQYSPHTRLGAIKSEPGGIIGDLAALYCEAILLDIRQEPLPDPLLHPEVFHVSKTVEIVDGTPCCVVKSRERALWFDLEHFSLRRLVQLRLTRPDDPGALHKFAITKDFIEPLEGVLLPKKVIWVGYYSQGSPASTLGTEESIAVYTVNDIELNMADDKDFEIEFPAGTMVTDRLINRAYYVPDGIDQLDEAIARGVAIPADGIIRNPPDQIHHVSRTRSQHGVPWRLVLIVGNIVAAALILGILLRSRYGHG
jgi:hypothetical protein